jgi:hypothetical protein
LNISGLSLGLLNVNYLSLLIFNCMLWQILGNNGDASCVGINRNEAENERVSRVRDSRTIPTLRFAWFAARHETKRKQRRWRARHGASKTQICRSIRGVFRNPYLFRSASVSSEIVRLFYMFKEAYDGRQKGGSGGSWNQHL